ncbi:hypothetical protein GLYMA_09G171832v4 [Glycine max]|nr:hypothetical protein GLYMA_09G171832v4 [Glycine max]KAH1043438.1 hypothetical protein GYH30_025326 [Glycine max]
MLILLLILMLLKNCMNKHPQQTKLSNCMKALHMTSFLNLNERISLAT